MMMMMIIIIIILMLIVAIIRTVRATTDMEQNVLETNKEVVYEVLDK